MGSWGDFWRDVFVPPGRGSKHEMQRQISTLEDYVAALNSFYYQNNPYYLSGYNVHQTIKGHPAESVPNSLEGYAQQAMNVNGAVFACMATRMYIFSAVRFQFQHMTKGRPGDLFSTPALRLLEKPWPGGSTQDMLIRMIQDADLCGNSYWVRQEDELVHLRPDWVSIILEPRRLYAKGQDPSAMQLDGTLGYRCVGYMYQQGGPAVNTDPVFLGPDEVAHFAPIPDPLASYRGMSPMTPILREIKTDGQMMQHKSKYLEQGATPNMIVSLPKEVTYETFKKFKADMEASSAGASNAYKTLYLAGGADVEVVGSDFKQLDFSTVQGHGETRIAAAFGVPPVIVGLSEGLESATYSNYSQARRRFADGTLHPLWVNACSSLATIMPNPSEGSKSNEGKPAKEVVKKGEGSELGKKSSSTGYRLWYDDRDVPFLREDRKDAADIQNKQAESIRTLVDAGYEPESVIKAVLAEDFNLMEHSGMFSIQLQPPGTMMGMPGTPSGSAGTGGTSPMKNPLPTSGEGFGKPGPSDGPAGKKKQSEGDKKPSQGDKKPSSDK